MREKSILSIIFLLAVIFASAQKSQLTVTLQKAKKNDVTMVQHTKLLPMDFLNRADETLKLDANKTFTYVFEYKSTQFVYIDYEDEQEHQSLSYSFLISPGDSINFIADLSQPGVLPKVTGKGSNNNQSLIQQIKDITTRPFYKDTVPDRVISAINKQQLANEAIFLKYISDHQPSTDFIQAFKLKLKYLPASLYFDFKENNRFQIRSAYENNYASWQKKQDSLFTLADLNNDEAINIPEYKSLVEAFLNRKKESLWNEADKNPDSFYPKWYNLNAKDGKELFMADKENDLQERIIKKLFSGKTAEYLYTVLIEDALEEANPSNLISIYKRFKNQYPNNEYVVLFAPHINKMQKRMDAALSTQMVIPKGNGTNIKTFKELLGMFEGKTVLLDMWGTWCGPCREEMERHSKKIKAHFNGKGLDYLYVANYDTLNEKKWRELIPYFDLQGMHILASNELTESIMKAVKGTGYPTYVIIRKDGSFELSKAGYPMDRNKLIKQLESALSQSPN